MVQAPMLVPKHDNVFLKTFMNNTRLLFLYVEQAKLLQLTTQNIVNTAVCLPSRLTADFCLSSDSGTWLLALSQLGFCSCMSKDRSPQVQDSRNRRRYGEGPFTPMRHTTNCNVYSRHCSAKRAQFSRTTHHHTSQRQCFKG